MPLPGTLQQTGNRIDVTTLTPFNNEATGGLTTGGAFTTLLSINGKGYLDSFYAFISGATAIQVRVTIDGIVTVLLGNATGNKFIGVASKNDLYPSSSAGSMGLKSPNSVGVPGSSITQFRPYPTTDAGDGLILLGDSYLYFYKSLLLETSSAGNGLTYRYSGAFKS